MAQCTVAEHAGRTVSAIGLVQAHIYVSHANKDALPGRDIPQHQDYDGSLDFIRRFHPHARVVKRRRKRTDPYAKRDMSAQTYLSELLTYLAGEPWAASRLPDSYLGPHPQRLLLEGYATFGEDAYEEALTEAWVATGWTHVIPICASRPLASSAKATGGGIVCLEITPDPERTRLVVPVPPYQRRRSGGTWPTLAEVYLFAQLDVSHGIQAAAVIATGPSRRTAKGSRELMDVVTFIDGRLSGTSPLPSSATALTKDYELKGRISWGEVTETPIEPREKTGPPRIPGDKCLAEVKGTVCGKKRSVHSSSDQLPYCEGHKRHRLNKGKGKSAWANIDGR